MLLLISTKYDPIIGSLSFLFNVFYIVYTISISLSFNANNKATRPTNDMCVLFFSSYDAPLKPNFPIPRPKFYNSKNTT